MPINIARLTKKEIVWMNTHRCKHGHTYLDHPSCYNAEHGLDQKVGFIDIEASQLVADWGIALCVGIGDDATDEIWTRTITAEELFSPTVDKKLMADVIAKMRTYDRLIGFYASNMRFDIPFLRTRAVIHGLDFPGYGEIVMEDIFPIVKYKFKLSSNRLANACDALLGESSKTKWLWKYWLKAIQGDKVALDYITDHCIKDVQETKKLYGKVYNFSRKGYASL